MQKNNEASREFEQIVSELLISSNFQLNSTPVSPLGIDQVDFSGRFQGDNFLVEAKYYRAPFPAFGLVKAAAIQLAMIGLVAGVQKALLFISGYVDQATRTHVQDTYGAIVIDRGEIFALCANKPALRMRLDEILESVLFDLSEPDAGVTLDSIASQHTTVTIRSAAQTQNTALPATDDTNDLIDALLAVVPGRDGWSDYEKVCTRILKALFQPELGGWVEQNRTDDGLQRFDLVCNVRPQNPFWKFVVEQLNSRYVLFEFKNYRESIAQGQVITTERYLFEMALRKVAFIVTRVDPDEGALQVCRGAMREHGKLIIALTDDDLIKMLKLKRSGSDPTDHLFDRVDEFLLRLSR